MPGSATPSDRAEGPSPAALAVRLLLSGGLLMWLTQHYGRDVVAVLLPALESAVGGLDDHYRVLSLSIGWEGADTVVRLVAAQVRPIVINANIFVPDPRGSALVTTPIGNVLQIPIVALGLILAWPARRLGEWGIRLGIGTALLCVAAFLDTPFVLWANVWEIHFHAATPDAVSPLLIWEHFLRNGGRLALGIAAAGIAIALAARLSRRARDLPEAAD